MVLGKQPRRRLKCGRCGRLRAVSAFHRSASRSTGYASYCKDCARETLRSWRRRRRSTTDPLKATALGLLNGAKARAKARGLPCTLDLPWILQRLHKGRCEATGVRLQVGAARATPWSASLDQLRAGHGYTAENTRMVSWGFNQLKAQDEDGDVYEWLKETAVAIKRHRLPT